METLAFLLAALLALWILVLWGASLLEVRATPAVGRETLVGAIGKVREPVGLNDDGLVFVEGELWRATADAQIPKGARVRVTKVNGLIVTVEPLP